jgi:proteasome lid subunit RPN8/RPN11
MKLLISRGLLEEVLSHCKEIYPNEACGFLAGEGHLVKKIYKIRNIKNSPVDYEMDPKEQLRCEKEMREKGLKLIGIYHSHPSSSAYPSQMDIARVYWPGDPDMPLYPDACYMIIGPVDGNTEVKVFKIDTAQQIKEIELKVT